MLARQGAGRECSMDCLSDSVFACNPGDSQQAEDSGQPRQRPLLRQADAEAVKQHVRQPLSGRRRRQRLRRLQHWLLFIENDLVCCRPLLPLSVLV